MADYFSEYTTFVGAKGLPSPADTPYETPGFIRSKRSSRVAASSREHSVSPPLPPDTTEPQEKARDGRYSALDPRRFTPTLHASLVSEILSLRRELDSKNNLVENLETSLCNTRNEHESLGKQLSESVKEVRKAKSQVQQMEKGVYDAVQDLVEERDAATATLDDLRNKFELTNKKLRQQDEDAQRTQSIWQDEKESWDNERRQLERRVHVTETRLRAVVDEMASQQSQAVHPANYSDESTFKDSGIGEGSDTASIRSTTPTKHRRNASGASFRTNRNTHTSTWSRAGAATPDQYAGAGNSLADELGIDEEDEENVEDFDTDDETLDSAEHMRRGEPRRGSIKGDMVAKAKRLLGLTAEPVESPPVRIARSEKPDAYVTEQHPQGLGMTAPVLTQSFGKAQRVVYVDTGCQPTPPHSPIQSGARYNDNTADAASRAPEAKALSKNVTTGSLTRAAVPESKDGLVGKPLSPPQTPVIDEGTWLEERASSAVAPAYSTASTQTEFVELVQPTNRTPKQDSLSPSVFVPSIAIHPPTSRPSSPRPYVLPPGTKNASVQANLAWQSKDASVQTERIRIDRRLVKLPTHLLPGSLLPSPTFQEQPAKPTRHASSGGAAKSLTTLVTNNAASASPPLQSPADSSPEMSRNNSSKDLRSFPLKALPLPRPVLSPAVPSGDTFQSNGPLNRSSQYGVSQPKFETLQLADVDQSSELSDEDDAPADLDPDEWNGNVPALSRPPPGRFGLSEPPKAVPEDKEISPERRPDTADSYGAAPAPSITSSRANSRQRNARQSYKLAPKTESRRDFHSRSPSFGSHASSSYSAPATAQNPPFPIPLRSSSRIVLKAQSEGSQSPTPSDVFAVRNSRAGRYQSGKQLALRKVQSAAVIRNRTGRGSPQKTRRRRRSPELTPVQSMAFEDTTPTKFPIPDLPTPMKNGLSHTRTKSPAELGYTAGGASIEPWVSEESNLVDAIAATMVGEWMWKYIRKRKSFGLADDNSEFPVADQNGIINMTMGHGIRHKRWVWLSPYERTIMWDTKQPTSGPALMGKKGRKLSIQSVLDVEDLTPLPKGAELRTAWNRSILILTPERALKFTATTEERHNLWMTALSFLAQSGHVPDQLPQQLRETSIIPPVPPVPSIPSTSFDGPTIKRHRAPSFGRSSVRDSIRLAKGKRPDALALNSQAPADQPYGADMANGDGIDDSAEFPAVPRLYITTSRHQRQRSNTSPRLTQPLNSFRSFSSGAVPTSSSSALQNVGSTNGSSFRPSASSKSGSRRESLASPIKANFFEAVGTVRMEAFVDPNVRDGVLYVPAPPPPVVGAPRRPRRGSNFSQSTVDKKRAGYVFDEDGMDPFKGF